MKGRIWPFSAGHNRRPLADNGKSRMDRAKVRHHAFALRALSANLAGRLNK
jgi:hypothetical protein